MSIPDSLIEEIEDYLYENSMEIGFCWHDVPGHAMRKIITTVLEMKEVHSLKAAQNRGD